MPEATDDEKRRASAYIDGLIRQYKKDGLSDREALDEIRTILEKEGQSPLTAMLLERRLLDWAREKGIEPV